MRDGAVGKENLANASAIGPPWSIAGGPPLLETYMNELTIQHYGMHWTRAAGELNVG